MKIRSFTVRGVGAFPVDMLRRDACYPSDTGDALSIACSWEEHPTKARERTVRLSTTSITAPHVERWASYGWAVLSESGC